MVSNKTNVPNANRFSFPHGIMIIVFVVCLFTIPFLFPPEQISSSGSYDYGFNNKIGMMLLAVFSVLIAIYSFTKNRLLNHATELISDKGIRCTLNSVFYLIIGITAAGCAVLWFILGRDSYGIIESGYFISHVYDIVFGRTIYKDFEFVYGPLLLFFPALIYKIFSFLSLSVSDSYMIALTVNQLLGLYFLYYTLSFFKFPPKDRNIIFVTISVFSFPFSTGLNYTLFRFLLPYFCFLALRQIERRNDNRPALYMFLLTVFSILCLLTSPELGLGFCFTMLVYLSVLFLKSKKVKYFTCICLLALVFFIIVNLLPGLFNTFLSFASGGFNWPFVPGLSLVVFFCAVFVVALVTGIWLQNINANLFGLSFILLSFSFIPGALGRCDPGHVFFNGLFIFVLAYSYIRTILTRVRYFFWAIFITAFLTLYPFMVKLFIPQYANSMLDNMRKFDELPAWVTLLGKVLGKQPELRDARSPDYYEIFNGKKNIAMLFGGDYNYQVVLTKSGQYLPLYYNLFPDGSKRAVEITLMELKNKKPEHIILPEYWEQMGTPADYTGIMKILFCTYYPATVKRNGNAIYVPLIEYINTNYTYLGEIGSSLVYSSNGIE